MIYHNHQSNVAFMNKKYLNKNFYKTPTIKKMQPGIRQTGNEKLRYKKKGKSGNRI